MPLLDIADLNVSFTSRSGVFPAVEGFSLTVEAGEAVGIVGESGAGKSVAMLAAMGLIEPPGRVSARQMMFNGVDLARTEPATRRRVIGKDIAMVFQEPASNLDPCYSIGFHIMETLRVHNFGHRAARRERAIEVARQVGFPPARLDAFPHQLSGGMAQRAMIAMAIACRPKLLIADEPTTALDVSVQAQIIALLLALRRTQGMALILITHDMGVVAEAVERVVVLYAGEVCEQADTDRLLRAPCHPYTHALLAALPERNFGTGPLPAIPGAVPGGGDRPEGCLFHPRCVYAVERCQREAPALRPLEGGLVRCHFPVKNG